MVMKFRNHKDPLYYNANANDKIFVPVYMVRNTTTQLRTSLIGGWSEWRVKEIASFFPW